ncbi:DNA-directed RNA polymerase II subunit GRINL1A [Galemys pyrenaicus]|uniref:DNA-directed RNA polymerase II subunit GRINL1A n=1 Tax=Galemys pyrenaicus TaxID=202257 RepID=A0A8J5ZQ85_GALPY|nr:DNA-directed RNA polymerase II subunit GRINL1A [Galemys pyrenaicus]
MSSLPRGFEPQAPEDLGQRSLAELREMLKRQGRLLRNEKFICKLPDKGKKILDSVAKLKAAIAEREAVRGKGELFHPVSLDCKLKQKAIAVVDVDTDKVHSSDQILDSSSLVPGCSSVDYVKSSETTSQQGFVHPTHKGEEEAPEVEYTVNQCPASSSRVSAPSSSEGWEQLPQHCGSSETEENSSNSDNLSDKLQRITIADLREDHSGENTSTENLTGLYSRNQKKPHYMEVLEIRAKNPVPPTHKFKTNVLPSQQNDSSSCQRTGSPISLDERRRMDKKHLDDITAARLLPLHHMPAQLLSIEESLALQKQQKQNYEEIQAKLAAQKLAERLNIKMQSYNPEGESSRKYRDVRDEDDDQSSDDEF